MDSINLVATMIGPVDQPIFPLLDAAPFNDKTNKIAEQILDEEQKLLDDYQAVLVRKMSEKLPAQVVIGDSFQSDGALKYKVKNGIQIDNKDFPVVFFAEGDMNPFTLYKGNNLDKIFRNKNDEAKYQIKDFVKTIGTQTILVSYNRLVVTNPRMFGVTARVHLDSRLFLYRNNGDLLLEVMAWNKGNVIDGKNVLDYQTQLFQFEIIAEEQIKAIQKYIK